MAVSYTNQGVLALPVSPAAVIKTTTHAETNPPAKSNKGQIKRLPLDGVRFDMPMRIRIGHMLALFGVSSAQFYKLRKAGKIPEPAGNMGTGTRPTPYWISTQVLPFLIPSGAE